MDGTLVNTEPLHAQAASKVLLTHNIIKSSEDLEEFCGVTDTSLFQAICPHWAHLEILKAIEEKNKNLITIFHRLSPKEKEQYTTPGIFEFLKFIKRNNKKCGVVSASEDVVVRETLACFGFLPYLDIHMGRNQTLKTKPHPDPYQEAFRRLNTHYSQTIIFEDSPTGIQSATQTHATVFRISEFTKNQGQFKSPHHFHEIDNFNFFIKCHKD